MGGEGGETESSRVRGNSNQYILCEKIYFQYKKKKPGLLASSSEDAQHVYETLVSVYLHSWKHHVAVSRLSFQPPGKTV